MQQRSPLSLRSSTGMPWLGTVVAALSLVVLVPRSVASQVLAAKAVPEADADVRLSAAARQFFAQGLAFADRGDWTQAVDRFERARQIRPSAVIGYNLALSLAELDRVLEASELLHAMESDLDADAELLSSTRRLLARVAPRLASLTVTLDPNVGTRYAVFLDGAPLLAVELGAPIPVDPTAHEVTLRRGRQVVRRYAVEASPGARLEVAVALPEALSRAAMAARLRAQAEQAARVADAPPITDRWWFWTGVGVVVAGAVTAVTVATLTGPDQRLEAPLP